MSANGTSDNGHGGAPPVRVVRRRSSRRRSGRSERSVRHDAPTRAEIRRGRTASGRRARRPTTPAEQAAIRVAAGAGGVVAALSGAHPAGTPVVDEVLTGLFAALVVLAASRAQRWTWLVLAGVATVVASSAVWQLVALAGVVAAFVAALLPRARWLGAASAALAVQGLLRQDLDAFFGASLLVGAAAVMPVLLSAWEVAPTRTRHVAVRVAAGAAAVVVLGAALAGLGALLAREDLEAAIADSQEGFEALADGRPGTARASLGAAADHFAAGSGTVGAWWSWPASLVPVVAQQREAVTELASAGEGVTRQAASAAAGADVQELRYTDGGVDLDVVRATREPLERTVAELEAADERVAAIRSPWLVTPVAERVDRFAGDLAAALPAARLASESVAEIPGFLGGEGDRRYLVLFTTPAESRGLGGFVGNWALLEAVDGRVDLTGSGRIAELNEMPGREDRSVTAPEDYVARYRRFRPAYWLQDTTLSPDFPSVARVWQELWPQLTGDELDGVISVDPYALAALLELTGPIRVEGWPEPLDSSNAAQVLLEDQYVELEDRDERADLLDEASRVAFEELTSGTLPSPRELSAVLAPVVEQGRLRVWTFEEGEQDVLRRVGLDGTFPRVEGSDLLALVTQNSAQNKIDVFLERDVDYRVSYDPVTGGVSSTATITLRNGAPADGLPDAVIGNNDQGLPLGTNRVWLSLYSPLGLTEARLDGRRVGVEFGREFPSGGGPGYSVYGGFFTIPPGGEVTFEVDLVGTVDPGGYELVVPHQPTVNADELHVEARTAPGWRFSRSRRAGVSDDGSAARLDVVALERPLELDLAVERD